MLRMVRKTWPWALGLALFFLLPMVGSWLGDLGVVDYLDVKGLFLAMLILVNPAAAVLVGGLVGYRHGFAWLLLPLVFVAWLPAMFIAYNDSALIYGGVYTVFALGGLGLGVLVRKVAGRRPAA